MADSSSTNTITASLQTLELDSTQFAVLIG